MKPPSAHEWFGLGFLILVYGAATLVFEHWETTKYVIAFVCMFSLIRVWWYSDVMEERRVKRETWRLYRTVSKQCKALEKAAGNSDDPDDDMRAFCQAVFDRMPEYLPEDLKEQFIRGMIVLYEWEDFDVTGVSKPPPNCNSIEGGKYRDALNQLSTFLDQHGSIRAIAIKRITEAYTEFIAHFNFHAPQGDVLAEVPIEQLANSRYAVNDLILPFFSSDVVEASVFQLLRQRLNRNYYEASGIEDTAENSRHDDLIPPSAYEGDELAWSYLRDTPLLEIAQARVPFAIPRHVRFEHTMIVGGSGHGKTTLLQNMILHDLEHAKQGQSGFAVIDPKGSLVDSLSRLACFEPEFGALSDRIVIIDPRRDAAYPPAVNMFDLGVEDADTASLADKLAIRNNALEMIEYMFSELLKVEMTGRQDVAFNYVGDLMMQIEGATIHTLLEFLNHPHQFHDHIAQCDHTTQTYLEDQFLTDRFKAVRGQLADRVYGVLKLPMMEAMFSHAKTKVDVAAAVNEGKIVLINANESFLSTRGSSVFGSVWIGLFFQACLSRISVPEEERTPFTLYIDEASMYFSEKLRQMLIKAREFKLGVVFAFQDMEQIESPQLRASALGSTSTKFVGGLNAHDRRLFANEMNTTEAVLRRPRKDQKRMKTEFATFVRGEMDRPVTLSFPIAPLRHEDTMSESAFETLISQNRERIAANSAGIPASPGRTVSAPVHGSLSDVESPDFPYDPLFTVDDQE